MLANTVLLLELLLILSWLSEKHLQVVQEEDQVSSVDIGSANPRGGGGTGHVSRWFSMGRRSLSPRSQCQELSLSAISSGAGLGDINFFGV